MSRENDKLTRLGDLIDDDVIEEVLNDSAAAPAPRPRRARFSSQDRRVFVTITSLVLALILIFSLVPAMLIRSGKTSEDAFTNEKPDSGFIGVDPAPSGRISIDTIDKLNYYGGMMSIMQSNSPDGEITGITPRVYSSADPNVRLDAKLPSMTVPETTEHGSGKPADETVGDSIEFEDIFYSLEEWGGFTVSGAVYFKAVLDSSSAFLCEKLGEGVIDVIITRNNIENMITFHRDGRFFSCLSNGGEITGGQTADHGGWESYSSHKYIDGKNIVKTDDTKATHFYVYYTGDTIFSGEITGLTCHGESTLDVVEGSTQISTDSITLTVSEIAAYFNYYYQYGTPSGVIQYAYVGKNAEGVSEKYIHIFTDGTFYICDEIYLDDPENPAAFYLTGDNAIVSEGQIFFVYIDTDGNENPVTCIFNSRGEFSFLGLLFSKQTIIGESDGEDEVIYLVDYDFSGNPEYYLRTNPDGTFIIAEPEYADPYYDGYRNHYLAEGYFDSNGPCYTFTWFLGEEQITCQIDKLYPNLPLVITVNPDTEYEFYLCDNPFPPDEVTEVWKTAYGETPIELHVTRDRHYSLYEADGAPVMFETGRIDFNVNDVIFKADFTDGSIVSTLGFYYPDGSIDYRGIVLYPEDHPFFTQDSSSEYATVIMRYDSQSGDLPLSVYFTRDGGYYVWNAIEKTTTHKGTCSFESNRVIFKTDRGGGNEEISAAFIGAAYTDGFTLEGVEYRLTYERD